jgi:hypothetical protein
MSGEQNPASTDAVNAVTKPLVGIGGWLILPAIGTFLAPLVQFRNFSDSVILLNRADESISDIILFDIASSSILFIASLRLLFLFVTKQRAYPIVFCVFMGLSVVSVVGGILLLTSNGFSSNSLDKDFFRSMLTTAIWVPYMLYSKRVKQTFVN